MISHPSGSHDRTRVRAGFIPLTDCAPLVVAAHLGFDAEEDLELQLVRETSWATLRDRLAVSHLDVAHMLGPMVVADGLGLTPLPADLIAPMALGFGSNAITVSKDLFDALSAQGGRGGVNPGSIEPATAARSFAAVLSRRRLAYEPPLTLAVVHAHSTHHYQLAYWLAYAGVRLGTDVELVVVPPSLTTAALDTGQIDGFCAGEPWGTVAEIAGVGRILVTGTQIWQQSPEKVLSVRRSFATGDPDRLSRIIRAVYRAALWCDQPENRDRLAAILSHSAYLGLPYATMEKSLQEHFPPSFAAHAATFPWSSHASWFYAQMVRNGQTTLTATGGNAAAATYRPDLYRQALVSLGAVVPSIDSKREGAYRETPSTFVRDGAPWLAPDAFFDGRTFEPTAIPDYLAGFAERSA